MKRNHKIIFLVIFALAAFFRLFGNNWDQGQHLHPDERFLTMVTQTIEWPKTLSQYFDAATSPLNPHNKNFSFFVYGLFPLLFVKFIAEHFNLADYANLTLVGRQLSGLVDLGTTVLVFLIGKQVISNYPINTNKYQSTNNKTHWKLGYWVIGDWFIPFLAMFFYAISVLPIQLSHFYATDPYLVFFITLTFYLGTRLINKNHQLQTANHQLVLSILMGISFGLALASKISGALFLPIPMIFLLISSFQFSKFDKFTKEKIFRLLFSFSIFTFLFLIFSYLFLRIGSPYTFATNDFFNPTLNPKVVDNWKQLKSFDDPNGWFPPAIQWIMTKPYLFPLKNTILWGLGLPLGLLSILAISYYLLRIMYYVYKRKFSFLILDTKYVILNTSVFWILLLFLYQGREFVKALRYFYPFYPFLALLSAFFIVKFYSYVKNKYSLSPFIVKLLNYFIVALFLIYPLSFMSIYTHLNTRIEASKWIYQNVPSGIYKSDELWDDGLPVSLENNIHENYIGVEFPLYNPDSPQKWQDMAAKLQKVNYIFLTSNRLYASIMTVPEKYPITNKYYSMLFDGSLGFKKVAEFTSRPNLPIPFIHLCFTPPLAKYGEIAKKTQECKEEGISFVDDYADETFTVYDHPKVTIFKKMTSVDYLRLLSS